MADTTSSQHARVLRGLLNDLRDGRPFNTGGDVQAAIEAAIQSLEGTGTVPRTDVGQQPQTRAGDHQQPPNTAGDQRNQSVSPEANKGPTGTTRK